MTEDANSDLIRELEGLLDLERKALIEGQLDQLGRMLSEKERLIESVGLDAIARSDQMLRLRKKVERNQALLESAADGVRSVINRMAELRRVRRGLNTYDASGRRNCYPVRVQAQLEKKA